MISTDVADLMGAVAVGQAPAPNLATPADKTEAMLHTVALWNEGRRDDALQSARRLRDEAPAEAEAHLLYARLAILHGGDPADALAAAAAAARLDPADPRAAHLVTLAALQAGESAGASAAAERLTRLRPESIRSVDLAGLAALAAGDTDRAEAMFDQSAATADGYVAQRGRAECLVARGKIEAAVDQLSRVSAVWPTYGEAITRRAELGSPVERLRTFRFVVLLMCLTFAAAKRVPDAVDGYLIATVGLGAWLWTLPRTGPLHTRVLRYLSREDGDRSGPWRSVTMILAGMASGIASGVAIAGLWDALAPGASWLTTVAVSAVVLAAADAALVRAYRPRTSLAVDYLVRLR